MTNKNCDSALCESINNEKEWRRSLQADIKEIKDDIKKATLKTYGLEIKMSAVAAIIAMAVSIVVKKLSI